ncbi:sigma factor-like helix-turn-helix DNA-binding protein [Asanoa sp. NPDC049518]|uniref:sigma factor-like helix-turn-helix DNA-binding protein n=1 Tax=Asanoa sp. NPDC049518 TaxID=3155503 RepID=UPI0034478D09
MQRALAVRTRRERAVVVLRFYEDLSETEIARTLDIAPGTVKSACGDPADCRWPDVSRSVRSAPRTRGSRRRGPRRRGSSRCRQGSDA